MTGREREGASARRLIQQRRERHILPATQHSRCGIGVSAGDLPKRRLAPARQPRLY
jgi:hypothetical protein